MSDPVTPVGEDDLQALVDERLPPDRAAAVAAYVAAHPEVAARVEAERRQRAALRARLHGKFAEPVPARLRLGAILAERRRGRWRRLSRIAAAAAYLVIGTGAGWFLHGAALDAGASRGELVVEAQRAHRTFVVEVRHPVEVEAVQEAHLVQWLSRRLGRDLKLPDLTGTGYRLVGGRLLPASEGPAAQFMYEDGGGRRLTLYVTADADDRPTSFRFAEQRGLSAFYWVDAGFGYAVLADVDRSRLLQVAETVYQQMNGARTARPR